MVTIHRREVSETTIEEFEECSRAFKNRHDEWFLLREGQHLLITAEGSALYPDREGRPFMNEGPIIERTR